MSGRSWTLPESTVTDPVGYYSDVWLHSAIVRIASKDRWEGRFEVIMADRDRELLAARESYNARCGERTLTERKEEPILPVTGETEASTAGRVQLARDSRLGDNEYASRRVTGSLICFRRANSYTIFRARPMPQKTLTVKWRGQ